MALRSTPVIPEYITVHLGLPDQPAENVRVSFADYIKNVASSEIYPNWPEAAVRRQHSGPDFLRPEPRLHGVLPQSGLRFRYYEHHTV